MTSIGDITVRTGYTPIRLRPLVLCHIHTASSVHDISALSPTYDWALCEAPLQVRSVGPSHSPVRILQGWCCWWRQHITMYHGQLVNIVILPFICLVKTMSYIKNVLSCSFLQSQPYRIFIFKSFPLIMVVTLCLVLKITWVPFWYSRGSDIVLGWLHDTDLIQNLILLYWFRIVWRTKDWLFEPRRNSSKMTCVIFVME